MDELQMELMQLYSKGYSCAQMLAILTLSSIGRENKDLVRAVDGLRLGLGYQGICGTLTGAACAIGIYTGKGADDEKRDRKGPVITAELVDWFKNDLCAPYNGITCLDILGEGTKLEINRCGAIIVATAHKLTELLFEHEIDPNEGRPL